jgi:hypothetical protein
MPKIAVKPLFFSGEISLTGIKSFRPVRYILKLHISRLCPKIKLFNRLAERFVIQMKISLCGLNVLVSQQYAQLFDVDISPSRQACGEGVPTMPHAA